MSHQPFESWNLDRKNLTPEQWAELDRHVRDCPICQEMRFTWESVQRDMRSIDRFSAPAGFASRFKATLPERRRIAHRQQIRKTLTILVSALIFILLLIAGYFIAVTPAVNWIGSAIQTIVDIPYNLNQVVFVITFWLSRISPWVWILAGTVPITWVMVLIITGALTYVRFYRQGETTK